jgi:hypothetical protein
VIWRRLSTTTLTPSVTQLAENFFLFYHITQPPFRQSLQDWIPSIPIPLLYYIHPTISFHQTSRTMKIVGFTSLLVASFAAMAFGKFCAAYIIFLQANIFVPQLPPLTCLVMTSSSVNLSVSRRK